MVSSCLATQNGRRRCWHLDSRIRKGLVIGGTVTFGACYLLSAMTASVADSNNDDEFAPLFVPVAGPFITIGTANAEGAGTFWLVVDGVNAVLVSCLDEVACAT